MRFYIALAVFSALSPAVIANPGHGNNLETRQPVSKTAFTGKFSDKKKPGKVKPCSEEGEHCVNSDDCCGTLLCGGNGCFKTKF
ncbi:hypothetical protein M0657_012318 [Pyricularia oryzae]|nr:hypothetical protein M0657_012318 [Pyricularia oryzae]KAI7908561.1 hypothetical protein M9X92_012124 [Pyricularia oryzae]